MKKRKAIEVPELSQLEEELSRVKYQKRYKRVLTSTVSTLIVVAAVAVLIATLLMPVLQINGASMNCLASRGLRILAMLISSKRRTFA